MPYDFVKLVKLTGDDKKYKVILRNKKTGREKSVKFGAAGMMDYTKYFKRDGKEVADMKKAAYIARHSRAGEDWTKSGIDTAGWWSRFLLWSKPTVEESLKSIIKKYF